MKDKTRSYYLSLKRRASNSDDLDELFLNESPESPEELRQYIDVISMMRNDIIEFPKILRNARAMLRDMDDMYPDNRNLTIAKRTLRKLSGNKILRILVYASICVAVFFCIGWIYYTYPKLLVFDWILSEIKSFFIILSLLFS